MQLLLDTRVSIWRLINDARLSNRVRNLISHPQNKFFISSAAAWEIAIKFRLGKLPGAQAMVNGISDCMATQGFEELALTAENGQRAGASEADLRDPLDRMLIAQSQNHRLKLIARDLNIHRAGVDTLW